jgi:hypothetical protein
MKTFAIGVLVAFFLSVLGYGLSYGGFAADELEVPGAGTVKGWKTFHLKHQNQAEFKEAIKKLDPKAAGCKNKLCHSAMPAKKENAKGPESCINDTCHNAEELADHIKEVNEK